MNPKANHEEIDCVALKQRIQEEIAAEIAGMSHTEEIAYFREQAEMGPLADWIASVRTSANELFFDDAECRCPDLVKLAREVFRAIPEKDREIIRSVCDSVVFERGGCQVAAFSSEDKHIRAYVYDVVKFSDSGKRGIIAHEFGHAFDFATRRIPVRGVRDRTEFEQLADAHAARWGFAEHIRIRDLDRERIWGPNGGPSCGCE